MALQHLGTDEELFKGIDMQQIEENLIEVDQTKEELEAAAAAAAEKPKDPSKTEPKPDEGGKTPPVEDDTIIVNEVIKPDDKSEDKIEDPPGGKKQETDKGSAPDDKKGQDESPSYLHAAALQEEGVLPNLDLSTLKDKPPEEVVPALGEHIRNEMKDGIKTGIDQYKSSLGPKGKEFLEQLDKGIPLEDLQDSYVAEAQYENISEGKMADDEALQKKVYSDFLALKNFSEGKISKIVEKAVQDGEIEEEAKDALREIKDTIQADRKAMEDQAEAARKENEKRNEETKDKIKTTVESIKEIIPGMVLTAAEKTKLIQDMTVPVRYENRGGREIPVSKAMDIRSKNPVQFETRLNYFIDKGFFNEDAKFEEFSRKQETSATQKLVGKLKDPPKQSGTPVKVKTREEEEDDQPFIFPQEISNY
jgi:hypothetical protein